MSDARVVAHVQALLVEPSLAMRSWDYGDKGDEYPCWTVLAHPTSNTGIAYCDEGFGPRSPWGLVNLEGARSETSIGMDCSWFTTFMQAFFDSAAATDLSIWRVVKTKANSNRSHWITDEDEWNTTWAQVKRFRESDPSSRYGCETSIYYEKE